MGIKRTMYFLIATLALLFFTFAAQGEEKPFITKWKGEAGKELKIPIWGKNYKLVIKKASDNSVLKTESALTITEEDYFYKFTPTQDGELLVEAGPEGVKRIRFVYEAEHRGSAESLLKVEKFGTVAWESMEEAFKYCKNMQFADGIDAPDLSNVTSMYCMFWGCSAFNQDLSSWNVSNVTYMGGMFNGCSSFNQDLSGWNVSNVKNLEGMFPGCSSFNQDLSSWNVSNVTCMRGMFSGCSSFNQDLSGWNVSNVTDMENMFSGCSSFNQNLGSWNLKNCRWLGLQNCGMSVENYSKSLEGWAAQTDIKEKLVLRADGLYFNETGKSARIKLIKEKHWVILGDVSEGGRVYDLRIGGVQLSTDNINTFQDALTEAGVLKKGKVRVTLEGEKPVLLLDNAELTAPYEAFPTYMLESDSNEVTIQLQGVCTITQLSGHSAIYVGKGTIVGRNINDKLLVKGNDVDCRTAIRNCTVEIEKELKGDGGALEIDNAVVKAKNIRNVDLILKNCSILQPEGAHYDASKKEVVDKDGKRAENVVIGMSVTGVSLSQTELSLEKGKTATLTATVAPSDATNKKVTWSSNNTLVATVEDGTVTAVSEGNATITVTTEDGKHTATCSVTVTPPAAVEDPIFASVLVSPNPFNTLLRISNGDVCGKYTLYNTQGVEVALGVLEGAETRINTESLPAGMYLLRLTAENGAQKTFTVVKR